MTRAHFDAIATRYDRLRHQLVERALGLLVREGDLAGRRVLDLGCGTGRFAAALVQRHGCTAFGVDPSPAMLAVARERSRAVTWLQGRAEELPLADDAVERAFLQTVVHLVDDRSAAFAELRRRFPAPDTLVDELRGAGFLSARRQPVPMRLRYTREEAAQLLRERFASSLAHISDAEIEAGARRAERELPPVIEPLLEMVLVVAR